MNKMLITALLTLFTTTAIADKNPNHWLRNAEDDSKRFQLLESQIGGFSGAMVEVGQRYESIYEALERDNTELALYHWEKIRSAIENGYQRRPGRQANADAMFLDTVWQPTRDAIADGKRKNYKKHFNRAREACMACHVAEEVPFMNDQSMFELKFKQ